MVDATSATGRAIAQRCAIHVPDILADPTYKSVVWRFPCFAMAHRSAS
jgi:hypothetical protein